MESADKLIVELYRAATGDQYQSFRERSLELVSRAENLAGIAWWSRNINGKDDLLIQGPGEAIGFEQLRGFAVGGLTAGFSRLEVSTATGGKQYLFHSLPVRSPWITTFWLSYQPGAPEPDADALARVCLHIVEAVKIALSYYIRHDDWLYALGRPSRGCAALVDGSGTVVAASERFYSLVGEEEERFDVLPFTLPKAVIDQNETAFIVGPLHFRVSRVDQLYLLNARKPLPLDSLSPREQEIARALGSGKTFKSVARQYGIAVSTVANHASRIYRKLAIYRREDLVALIRAPDGSAGRPSVHKH